MPATQARVCRERGADFDRDPGAAGSVGLQLFRYQLNNAGTLGTAPTIADAGDHIIAFMFSARDHWTGGDPLDALATSVQATATTSATGPGVTTQVNDATLLCIIANATDTATTQGSSASNADLNFVGFGRTARTSPARAAASRSSAAWTQRPAPSARSR